MVSEKFFSFMVFLYDHLKKGSFRTAYADTDSMCLGLTRSKPLNANMSREEEYRAIFDPIVKPEMRDSWEKTWKSWFVTTSEVEDERFPGKLKSECISVLESRSWYLGPSISVLVSRSWYLGLGISVLVSRS